MLHPMVGELSSRGASWGFGLILGTGITWLVARWRRRSERRRVREGDARETIVIHLHVLDRSGAPGRTVLRIRTIGQADLCRVAPNGHLADVLRRRVHHVTAHDTLISMAGVEGSFLLETLTNFVCDRAANAPFSHDVYIMAPCCEPKELVHHQPTTILLVPMTDLAAYENWETCQGIWVEHGSDGIRLLSLLALARRFRAEQEELVRLRREGKRTQFIESMYTLDLALDQRTAALESKPVPWTRYESVLKELSLK